MAVFKDSGVVLREEAWGEAGKRLTLLLRGRGRVLANARGARKPGSPLRGLELFAYGDFVLYDGGGFLSVTQADLRTPFYNLRADYDRLRAAGFCAELVDKTLYESENAAAALRLLLTALRALDKGEAPIDLALAAFQFRYLRLEGFSPVLDECSLCGEAPLFEGGGGEAAGGRPFAGGRFGGSGLVCAGCAEREQTVPFGGAAAALLSYILDERTGAADITTEAVAQLTRAAELFRNEHIGIEFKSLSS